MTYRFKQYVNSIVFKYFSEQWDNYLIEVFDVFRQYIVWTFWKKSLDTLECTDNRNTFKQFEILFKLTKRFW